MSRTLRRRNRSQRQNIAPVPSRDYQKLKNTLGLQPAFSQDHVEDIHQTALRVLDELGIRVLNQEARDLFKRAGASVDEKTQMVSIQSMLVDSSLLSAPSLIDLQGARKEDRVSLGGNNVAFVCVVSCGA